MFFVVYALGEDAGSGSGAVQLGGFPMSGQQFGDLLGRVIGAPACSDSRHEDFYSAGEKLSFVKALSDHEISATHPTGGA